MEFFKDCIGENKRNLKVSFSTNNEVYFSNHDNSELWYKKDDYEDMKKHLKIQLKVIMAVKRLNERDAMVFLKESLQ